MTSLDILYQVAKATPELTWIARAKYMSFENAHQRARTGWAHSLLQMGSCLSPSPLTTGKETTALQTLGVKVLVPQVTVYYYFDFPPLFLPVINLQI